MSDAGGGKDDAAPVKQRRPVSAGSEQQPSKTASDGSAIPSSSSAAAAAASLHVPSAPGSSSSSSSSLPHRTSSLVANVPSSRVDRLLLQRLRKSQSGTTLYGDGQAALATAESDAAAAALLQARGSGSSSGLAAAAVAAQLAQASLGGSGGSGGSGSGGGGFVGPSSSSVPPSPSPVSSSRAMPPPPSGASAAPLSSSAPDSSAALFMSAALAKAASASRAAAEDAAAATASASAAEAAAASATAAAVAAAAATAAATAGSPSRVAAVAAAAAAAVAAVAASSSPTTMRSPSPVPPAVALETPPPPQPPLPPPPPPPATGTTKSSAYHGAVPPAPAAAPRSPKSSIPGAATSAPPPPSAAAQAAAAAEFVAAAQAAGAGGASPRSGGETSRLIVVANRLPVSASRDKDGAWRLQVSAGGLVSALMSVRSFRTVWVGWPGVYVDESDPARASLTSALGAEGYAPVYLDPKTVDLHYNGFCNSVLWQLFHYVPLNMDSKLSETRTLQFQWAAHQAANATFADAVLAHYQPGDVVWVQDYHLMLLPALLKLRVPRMKVGWFLHTPFPSSEIYRTLPVREEVLRAVLKADLIGFHTYDYARHFVSACTRILGLEGTPEGVEDAGSLTRVAAFPIGIDPERFAAALERPDVRANTAQLLNRYAGRKVMLGVDRLDVIKGIPQKLLAFEKFLEEHPEWRDKVLLVQIAVPSRTDVPEYRRLRSLVHEIVGRINGHYGTLTHVPIHHLDRQLSFPELAALYAITDVCLVTSLRDGMNLVSYEFVACQADNAGVLVLSEFAGAAQSLGAGAILVNPWNVTDVAAAIGDALTLSDAERRERHRQNYHHIVTHTAQAWADTFISELNDTHVEAELRTKHIPPQLDSRVAAQAAASCRGRRLLVLGFNATLTSSSASDAGVGVGATGMGVCDDIERIISAAGGGGVGGSRSGGNQSGAMAAALTAAAASKRQQQFDALAAAARVSPAARAAVERLAADPRNVIVIFSGSDRAKLDEAFGNLKSSSGGESGQVWLAAENGVFVKPPGRDWAALIEPPKKEWMDAVQTVFDYFCERTPRSYVEARATSVVWNYKHADAEFGRLQARDLLQHLWTGPISNARVDIVQGSRSVEVRPVGVSKGLCMQRIVGAMAEEAAAASAVAAAAAAAAKVAAEVEASARSGNNGNTNDDADSAYPPPSSSPVPTAEEAAAHARASLKAAAAANEPFDFVLVAGHFLARDENIFTFFEGRLPSEADGGADGLTTFPPRAPAGFENGGWQGGGLPGDIGGVFGGVGVGGGQFPAAPPSVLQQQQQQQQQQQAAAASAAGSAAGSTTAASSDSYSAGHSLRGAPGMPPRSPQRSSNNNASAPPPAAGSSSPSPLHPLPESPNEGLEDGVSNDAGGNNGYSDNGKPSSPLPVPRSKQAYVPGEAAAAVLAAEAAAAAAAAGGGGGVSANSSPSPPPPLDAIPPSSPPSGPAAAAVAHHHHHHATATAGTGAATPPTPASADWAGASLLPFLPPANLFTLTVGRKRSQARYFLSGSTDVAELLMSVSEATARK